MLQLQYWEKLNIFGSGQKMIDVKVYRTADKKMVLKFIFCILQKMSDYNTKSLQVKFTENFLQNCNLPLCK